jgi:hypothetical protein
VKVADRRGQHDQIARGLEVPEDQLFHADEDELDENDSELSDEELEDEELEDEELLFEELDGDELELEELDFGEEDELLLDDLDEELEDELELEGVFEEDELEELRDDLLRRGASPPGIPRTFGGALRARFLGRVRFFGFAAGRFRAAFAVRFFLFGAAERFFFLISTSLPQSLGPDYVGRPPSAQELCGIRN